MNTKPRIEMDKVYQPSQKMAFRTISGKAVLIDTSENIIITLNETASAIWNAMDGRTVEDIAQNISNEFSIDKQTALEDTVEFLTEIVNRNFISVVS